MPVKVQDIIGKTDMPESVLVENAGGTAINSDTTFDGYTIQQIVYLLRGRGYAA